MLQNSFKIKKKYMQKGYNTKMTSLEYTMIKKKKGASKMIPSREMFMCAAIQRGMLFKFNSDS